MEKTKMTDLIKIKEEIRLQLGDKETFNSLVTTTFKGLAPTVVPKAIMEGMMRGFTFKDFLEKNVYAIPFKDTYSLVTSLDYARKVGMRSGVVGKSAPQFEEKDGKIISCTVTIKRKVENEVGEYSATVYFDEYNTGRNLWASKPRTMLAKVAEMHALRAACPEELAKAYSEDEMTEAKVVTETVEALPPATDEYRTKLSSTKSLKELQSVWSNIPGGAKTALTALKDELKTKYADA